MKLIINADDYGIDIDRDIGIFICSIFKIITSTSVIVTNNLSFIKKQMIKIMHKRISIGIHINLTDNPLATCNMENLCKKNYDNMRAKHIFWTNCLKNSININLIEKEIKKQLEIFYHSFGFAPEHIDFHNHCNIFNKKLQSISENIAEKRGIFLRIPYEEYKYSDIKNIFSNDDASLLSKQPKNFNEIIKNHAFYYKYDMITYNYLCKTNCNKLNNIKYFGSVYGYYRNANKFCEQTQNFSQKDIVQFMTHPGFYIKCIKHKSKFSNSDRIVELLQLFKIKKYCRKKNITLISYKDITNIK